MNKKQIRLIIIAIISLVTILACGISLPTPEVPMAPEVPETLAAETWSAMQTSAALSATATEVLLLSSDTPLPSETPTVTNTPTATQTPIPMLTALPTNTPEPTSTPTLIPTITRWYYPGTGGGGTGGTGGGGGATRPCLAARLVRDIIIPENQFMTHNQRFTKVWRIENIGSCIWNSRIKFVPVGSNPFFASSISVPNNVRPGKSVDIAVNLISPSQDGSYTGRWYFNADGERFGNKGDNPFTAYVHVRQPLPNLMFEFSNNLCQAFWRSNAKSSGGKIVLGAENNLTCPGKAGNPIGFVRKINTPEMESGSEAGPAIWSAPPEKEGGVIEGVFPAMLIYNGDHFQAQIGCRQGDDKCDVRFELTYKVIVPPSNTVDQNTISWHETYDGTLTPIDINLSSLAGNYVQFVLRVRANNNSDENGALWVRPRIVR
jgi:hypothetical protein